MTFPSYRVASVEDLLARCMPAIRPLVQAARRRVLTVVPHATERLRAGWGLLGYDAPRYFAYVAPMKDHVRIGFERGVLLDDPAGLLEGNGSQVRHVVVRSSSALRSAALAALLRQAAGVAAPAPPARTQGRPTWHHPWMTTTCAWIFPSTGPAPKRSAIAAVHASVASARPSPERASISFRSGVPWQ